MELSKLVAFEASGPGPLAADAGQYWALGSQVADGDLWMTRDPIAYRTPGYPWTLGTIQTLCGAESWRVTSRLQYVAVALTTVLTFFWTWRLTRNLWLANMALLLRAVSVAGPSYASLMLTESFMQPVFLTTVWLLSEIPNQASLRRWVLIGGGLALGLLFRPVTVALAPVVLVVIGLEVWPQGRARWWREVGWRLGIAAGITFALIGPWCVRNWVLFGKPAPVVFLGRELWIATFGPGRPDGAPLPESPEAEQIRQSLRASSRPDLDWGINWHVSPVLTDAGLSDAQADDLMQTVAWQAIRRDPLRAVLRTTWRTIDFWRVVYDRELLLYGDQLTPETTPSGQQVWGTEADRAWRARWLDLGPENWLLVMELGSLLGLVGALGLAVAPETWRTGVVMGGVLVATCLLTAALDLPNYRYRMILEPLLIVGGVAGGASWCQTIAAGLRSRWQRAGYQPDIPGNSSCPPPTT